MITEKGTIKSSTPIDERTIKELNKTPHTLGIVYTVGGAILLALWLIVLIAETLEGTYESFDLFLFLGAVFLGLGIFMLASCNKLVKSSMQRKKVDEVEFFRDHMIVREYTNGEHTSTTKIYYKWIVKTKETHNYLFIYNTNVTALSVDKTQLTPQEFAAVKNLLQSRFAPVQPGVYQGC